MHLQVMLKSLNPFTGVTDDTMLLFFGNTAFVVSISLPVIVNVVSSDTFPLTWSFHVERRRFSTFTTSPTFKTNDTARDTHRPCSIGQVHYSFHLAFWRRTNKISFVNASNFPFRVNKWHITTIRPQYCAYI